MKKISVSDQQFHQPLSIANTLNSYFYDIVSALASALPPSNHHYESYVTNHRQSSIQLVK